MNIHYKLLCALLLLVSSLSAQILTEKPAAYWSFENTPAKMNEIFYSQYGEVETYWYDYAEFTNAETIDDNFGSAVKFDYNSPHLITKSNPLAGAKNGSISMWVKLRQIDNQYRGFFSHYVSPDNNNGLDNWAINFNGAKKAFDFRSAGKGAYCDGVTVEANRWYHLVYTWEYLADSTTQYNYYINNEKQAQSRILNENYTDGSDESSVLKFGEDRDTKRRPRGRIDEIVLYRKVLSTLQIDSLYTQGLSGEPFQRDILDSISVSSKEYELFEGQKRSLKFVPFPTEASLNDGFSYSSSAPDVVSINAEGAFECVAEGRAVLTQTFKGNTSIADSCVVTVKARVSDLDILPVALWPMESSTNYESTDDWMAEVKATKSKSIDWETAGYWWAPSFNYGGGFLQTASNPITKNKEFSVMAWVKLQEDDNQYRGFITLNSASYANWGFSKHTDMKIDARFNNNSVKSDVTLIAKRWYHVAITVKEDVAGENSECKLYVDGQLQSNSKTVAGVFSNPDNDDAVWRIGTDRDLKSRVPRAHMDDVAMFDKALTQEEIQSLIVDIKPMTVMLGLLDNPGYKTVNHSRVQIDYDLGKLWSPVQENWSNIAPETNGEVSWSKMPQAVDLGGTTGENEANQDFVTSTKEITLNHKLDNGQWIVKMNFGDATAATSGTQVSIEGVSVSPVGGISTGSGEIVLVEKTITVTDGELNITVSNTSEAWKWTRLSLRRVDTEGRIGTLMTADDEPIRAAPLSYAKSGSVTVPYAHDINTWFNFKDLHYNAFRVTWTDALASMQGRDIWTEEEMVENFSKIVANAEKSGMTAIINYHNVGEQGSRNPKGADYEMTHLEWFWSVIAKNFGNNPRVMFELQNEPSFSYNGYVKPEFKVRFLEIYNMVRELAPETQLIVFSPSPFGFIDDLVMNYYDDLDWDYTTAGYHLYSGNNSAPIQRAANLVRTVCTEYDFNINIPSYQYQVDGKEEPHHAMEAIGQGWMDWGNHQGPLLPHAWLIPDALEKGYAWWKESDVDIKWINPTGASMICEGDSLSVEIAPVGSTALAEISLYLDGEWLGSDTEAPYQWSAEVLDSMLAGNYILRAALTDINGGVKYDHLPITVFHGMRKDIEVFTPEANVWVSKNGSRGHTDAELKQYVGTDKANEMRSYLRFNLKDKGVLAFKEARLRLYNKTNSDQGWMMLHEILDDTWDAASVTYADGPKNVGYPGRSSVKLGDGNEAAMKLCHTGAWVEYDVTAFLQQEFADDSVLTFMLSNLYDGADGRFDNNFRSNEMMYFASMNSDNAPQLILSDVENPIVLLDSAKIDQDSIVLNINETFQLNSVLYPADADVDKFLWLSLTPSIADVDVNGLVTARAVGETQVYMHNNGNVWETCIVTVADPSADLGKCEMIDLKISPNPASSIFYIEMNECISQVKLYSMSGHNVLTIDGELKRKLLIDATPLHAGVYLVELKTSAGQLYNEKITIY